VGGGGLPRTHRRGLDSNPRASIAGRWRLGAGRRLRALPATRPPCCAGYFGTKAQAHAPLDAPRAPCSSPRGLCLPPPPPDPPLCTVPMGGTCVCMRVSGRRPRTLDVGLLRGTRAPRPADPHALTPVQGRGAVAGGGRWVGHRPHTHLPSLVSQRCCCCRIQHWKEFINVIVVAIG
jgi:hypothetical protein